MTEPAAGVTATQDRAGRAAADLDAHTAVGTADAAADVAGEDPQLIEDIEEALKDVVDPELGINIVDLGLVYDLHVDPANVATIDMTLTSAACPLTDMIEDQVAAALVGGSEVDLGLVYDLHVDPANVATIDMTLTSAACPLTDMIEDQVAAALVGGSEGGLVADFRINWVWLPPWGPERITEDGREQMRALGFNI